MILLLLALNFTSKSWPYCEHTFSNCWTPALYGLKMTRSSAYIRWLINVSPAQQPAPRAFNNRGKSFIYILKRNGDRIPPWRTLLDTESSRCYIPPSHSHGLVWVPVPVRYPWLKRLKIKTMIRNNRLKNRGPTFRYNFSWFTIKCFRSINETHEHGWVQPIYLKSKKSVPCFHLKPNWSSVVRAYLSILLSRTVDITLANTIGQ